MPRKYVLYVLSFYLLLSCKQTNTNYSIKDKALKLFVDRNDSMCRDSNNSFSYGLDSNDYRYKALKASYLNDTTFLNHLIIDFAKPLPNRFLIDTFEKNNIPNLRNLNINEGYQFNYAETFCNLYYVIIITRLDSLIQLETIVYFPIPNTKDNSFKLKVVEATTKILTHTNWNELLDALNYADYWNLLPRSKEVETVLDPSHLTVLGIQKEMGEVTYLKSNHDIEDTRKYKKERVYETKRTNRVERLMFRNRALFKAFLLALKFSGLKKLCEEVIKD